MDSTAKERGLEDFKKRWDDNVKLFNDTKDALTVEEAQLITTLKEGKSPFFNALDYGYSLKLYFQDPAKPKQILARSLAEIIVKLAS